MNSVKSKSATKNHRALKKKIAKKLNVGATRIKFRDAAAKLIFGSQYTSTVSNVLTRDLVKKKQDCLRILPAKRRLYKVYTKKKKLVVKDAANKAALLKDTVITKKKPEFVKEKLLRYKQLKLKLKIKDRYKDHNSLNYMLKKKLVNQKDLHMDKMRSYRKILKENKSGLSPKQHRLIYLRVKGNLYQTVNALLLDIESKKNVQI